MSRANEIVQYQKNDILSLSNALSHLIKTKDVNFFVNFANAYGPQKISKIVNTKYFPLYNLAPNQNFDVVDRISKQMLNKLANKQYVNSILFSPYYYKKFVQNTANGNMQEVNVSIAYNAVVDNKSVDVKHRFTVEEIKNLVDNKKVVLLGVKEKIVDGNAPIFENLTEIEMKDFLAKEYGFVTKNIMPSITHISNAEIMQNVYTFEARYPNFLAELAKVDIAITKLVLQHELENQQIVLNGILENGQKNFMNLVNEYQTKSAKIQRYISQNQKLLNALDQQKQETAQFENVKAETFENKF